MLEYNQPKLIEEVKKRPGLWSPDAVNDRDERLTLWKQVGAAMFADWHECSKATAYDRVIQLQKKWRSLRDAYKRELRGRASGKRTNKCVYRYFRDLSFLGGLDGNVSDATEYIIGHGDANDHNVSEHGNSVSDNIETLEIDNFDDDPLLQYSTTSNSNVKRKAKKRKIKRSSDVDETNHEEEMPVYTIQMSENETDSDKLFLLSFLPEMKKLPVNVKMWVRAQIANTMQEAVNSHYENIPLTSNNSVKKQRQDSSD